MRTYFYIIRHALKQKHKICVWSFYIPMYHCALYVHWPENGQCQGNNQMIGDYLLKLKREYDHSLLVNRDSACPTSKVQLPPRRSKYSILCFYIPLRCLELKSYGFEKKLVDSCQAPTRSCQYTKSLVNMNSFYTNFTNTHFQKVPIPHLTRTMKQKFLH